MGKLHVRNGQAELDTDAFLTAFDQGVNTRAKRPEVQEDHAMQDQLSGAYADEVGETKAGIMAQSFMNVDDGAQAHAETLDERFQSLFYKMTHHQVARRIARNVQRELGQVRRGS